MGRAPCCEKMGLKKGPWTPEEDQILINYIRLYGHSNWRALPKQAGLLRCGKSCRLRWINYLRPDIKRGNFTPEEEETIIKLHEMLGNRWSAIAAKLPGRTDNEIKNVWHTHLKKRIKQSNNKVGNSKDKNPSSLNVDEAVHNADHQELGNKVTGPFSPPQQSSCSNTTLDNADDSNNNNNKDLAMLTDESFWSDIVSMDNYVPWMMNNNALEEDVKRKTEIWEPPLEEVVVDDEDDDDGNSKRRNYAKLYNDDVEFWFGLLTGDGELFDIPEF